MSIQLWLRFFCFWRVPGAVSQPAPVAPLFLCAFDWVRKVSVNGTLKDRVFFNSIHVNCFENIYLVTFPLWTHYILKTCLELVCSMKLCHGVGFWKLGFGHSGRHKKNWWCWCADWDWMLLCGTCWSEIGLCNISILYRYRDTRLDIVLDCGYRNIVTWHTVSVVFSWF